jgi:hypothetical protein
MKKTLAHFGRQVSIKKQKSWNQKSSTLIRSNKNKLISRYRPFKKNFVLIIYHSRGGTLCDKDLIYYIFYQKICLFRTIFLLPKKSDDIYKF